MTKKSVFGTREWAKYNANACSGCFHDCTYCYAKTAAIQREAKTTENWKEETPFSKAPYKKWELKNGTVMFPTVHDITPNNLDVCLEMLGNMLEPGNKVLIVSKPHKECIKRLCNELIRYKDNILFRFTIGSVNDHILKLWEPNAPNFAERLESLAYAFQKLYATSVSCEPMLDGNIDHVIEQVSPYITDAIWLGKMNYATARLRTNGHVDMIPFANRLDEIWSDSNIRALYERYRNNPLIKWKESIKKVIGLEIPTEAGLDK